MSCARPGCTCADAPLRNEDGAFCSPACAEQARSGTSTPGCGCRHPECEAAHPAHQQPGPSTRSGVR